MPDSITVMNTSLIIRIVTVFAVIGSVLYYKIPLPCHGCDKGSVWYRCVNGTGDSTKSCETFKATERRAAAAGKLFSSLTEQASAFIDKMWEFDISDLPEMIGDFINVIKESLMQLKSKVSEKIQLVIAFLKDKAAEVFGRIKGAATDVYDNHIRKIIDPMVAFVMNSIVSPFVNIINKIIEFRNLVWNTLKTAYERIANIGIGDFVGDVVDIAKKIPEGIENLKELIVELINNMKGKLFNVVNGAVSGTVSGVNRSVNVMSDSLEKSIKGIVTGINNTMNVAESGVGGIVTGVNASMNKVEDVVNDVSNGVESSVNKIVTSVNSVGSKISQIKNKEIKIARWGVKPFSFLGSIPSVRSLKIPTLNINDIKKPNFPDVKSPNIPGINLKAPRIKEPDDIDSDDLNMPSIPGFGFVSAKIASLKESIVNIFETAMAPLYDAVAILSSSITTVVASVSTFINEYLTFDSIKKRIGDLFNLVLGQKDKLVGFIQDTLVPAFITLIKAIADPILEFVGNMSKKVWSFMKLVGTKVAFLFKKAFELAKQVLGKVASNAVSLGVFTIGTTADNALFFLPTSVTVKILVMISLFISFIIGPHLKMLGTFGNIAKNSIAFPLQLVSDLDKSLDKSIGI